jgi:hypothetical protein
MYAKKFSSGFSRALKIIVAIWTVSGLLALPYSFTSGVYFEYPDFVESKTCGIYEYYKVPMTYVIQLSVLFLFIVPMTLISIMYVLIGVTLWKSQLKHGGGAAGAASTFTTSGRHGRTESTTSRGFMARMTRRNNRNNATNASINSNSPRFQASPEISSVHASNVIDLRVNGAHIADSMCSNLNAAQHHDMGGGSGGGGGVSSMVRKSNTSVTMPLMKHHRSGGHHGGGGGSRGGPSHLSPNARLTLPHASSEISINECGGMNSAAGSNDRTSKEFEHMYRARQSRRDVVKMLCKCSL